MIVTNKGVTTNGHAVQKNPAEAGLFIMYF